MPKRKKILNLMIEQGIVVTHFHPDHITGLQVLTALYAAGIRTIEYTNMGQAALDNFMHLRHIIDKDLPGLYLGVGTIKNQIDATEFINVGADFVISPGLVPKVAALAHKNEVLWVPGCMTVTEIIQAEDLGAEIVNLFPGSLLGTSYVSGIKELFPNLLFMTTDGVELERQNLKAWFRSGISVVGIGDHLIVKNALENKSYSEVTTLTKQALDMVQSVRTGRVL